MAVTRILQHSGYYEQIDLEDLHKPDSSQGIALNLQNIRGFLDGVGDPSNEKDRDSAMNPGVSLVRFSQ